MYLCLPPWWRPYLYQCLTSRMSSTHRMFPRRLHAKRQATLTCTWVFLMSFVRHSLSNRLFDKAAAVDICRVSWLKTLLGADGKLWNELPFMLSTLGQSTWRAAAVALSLGRCLPLFLPPDEKVMADDEFTCDLFRFLQLLCEGHNNGESDTI